jgi:hypothetical protein
MDSVHAKTLAASFKLSSNSELATLNNRQPVNPLQQSTYHVTKKSDLHKLFAHSHKTTV